jgi:membrane protein implicated in regulation of membrane protease activity
VATLVEGRGDGVPVQPSQVAAALGPSLEWQLVAVCGRVQRLTKAGSRWRADLTVDGQTVAVLGEPGAGISSSGIVAGRLALVTGIVRRSTSDPSVFQLLPRSAADLILGPAPASSGRSAAAAVAGQASGSGAAGASAPAGTLVTVSEITGREGETVTVAGLIVGTGPATATLDDGTGRVRLGGTAAADALSLLEPGDAVEVTGLVSRDADGWLIEVDPDLIVTLAGGGSGAPASSDRSADNASPSADAASDAPGLEAPAARGQTHGLALAAGGIAGPSPIELIALFGGGLALVALLGLTVARAVRARRLRARPERPERSFRDAREHAMSPPDDLANGRYSSSERATAPGRDQGHA